VQDRFTKNRLFVSCESATSPETVLGLLAMKLGINPAGADVFPTVLNVLQARQRTLVILDNFESIWSPIDVELAEAAEIFLAQLSAVDELTLVITTRGNALPDCVYWANSEEAELDTLSSTAARQTFEDLTTIEPEVLASQAEAVALTQLLREIDFVPLAITLLARLEDLPSSLLREWHDVFTGVLEADYHDGTRRELSVDISIKISLAHLSRDPQLHRLLPICSQLPAGIFPETSEKLRAALSRIDLATTEVLRHSLVYLGSAGELKMLSPIRHYVRLHLALTDFDLVNLQRIYMELTTRFPSKPNEHVTALAALVEHEYPNALAILGTMVVQPTEDLMKAASCLFCFSKLRGLDFPLWKQLLPHLDDQPLDWKAQCMYGLCMIHAKRGELDDAILHAQAAIDLLGQSHDRKSENFRAILQQTLSLLQSLSNRPAEAERYLNMAARHKDPTTLAIMYDQRTMFMLSQGNYVAAAERARLAREEAQSTSDYQRVAKMSRLIAYALEKLGNDEAAVMELEVAHALHLSFQPDSLDLAACKLALIPLHLRRNSLETAESLLIEAHAIFMLLDRREGVAAVTSMFSTLRAQQGRRQNAIDLAQTAALLFREMGYETDAKKWDAEALWMAGEASASQSSI